eukprot:TRINITY_DN3941_c0_g1_i1.p1 TRINITY_DN3941_c0_g1~~TRINITY_DN3941_c0_g1_i1.p1  ORF type:complete len:607 (+),score=209.55 TRINITY_DN3941_c0_g1_i1:94-1821(+)
MADNETAPQAAAPTTGDENTKSAEPLSAAKQKKLARQQQKEANRAKRGQAQQKATEGENFGKLPLIQSQKRTGRVYTPVRDANESLADKTIWIRARLQTCRGKGNLIFLVLRQGPYSLQAVAAKSETITKDFLKFLTGINKESIVDVEGQITIPKDKIESVTQQDVELSIKQVWIVSAAAQSLPLLISDAEVPQPLISAQKKQIKEYNAQIEELNKQLAEEGSDKEKINAQIAELTKAKSEAQKYTAVSRKQRLDNRVIDLRTSTNQAIFRVQSAVCQLFREYLLSEGFVEIHTPKIISAASEGGADVFEVTYFDGKAYLAQSPQLYKQMAITADFEKVFEVAPVFRAENSQGPRHLTEFVGLDLEMAFNEHYHEVLDVLDKMFIHIFDGLKDRTKRELDIVRRQFPFEDLEYLKPSLRLKFPEAIALLREAGETVGDYDDLSTPQEKLLGKLVKEKYKTDFFILDKFPSAVRPFYTMPDPENPNYSNAYDIFLRGQEIVSGGQRIHDPEMLTKRAIAKGVSIPSIQAYIDSFKYGAPPHGGGGVGMERVAMLYMGLKNIRSTSMFPRDPTRITP